MSKVHTPAMEKAAKRRSRYNKKGNMDSPFRQAARRLMRNKSALVGLGIIVVLILLAIFANVIAPYDPNKPDYAALKQAPSMLHLFGTDALGRDILSRCLYGSRVSLLISVACVITSFFTGGLVGTIAGYRGGRTDNIIMRIMDVFQAIPTTMMALSMIAVLGNGITQLIVAITISFFAGSARNFRAAVLSVKSGEFIEASKAIDIGTRKMIFRHLIPNAIGIICLFIIGQLAHGIVIVSSLSYIGVGLQPPTADWGGILSQGKAYFLAYPHMVLFPAMCIMLAVFGFNLFGNGLRDALDPRLN